MASESSALDRIDRRIIGILDVDARISWRDLGQRVHLSPTSAAIVENSVALVGIGGGEVARDGMLAARAAHKPVSCHAAAMNHRTPRDSAVDRGRAEPVDFRGAAGAALAGTR